MAFVMFAGPMQQSAVMSAPDIGAENMRLPKRTFPTVMGESGCEKRSVRPAP